MGSCQCRKFCLNEQGNQNLQQQEVATNDDFRTAVQETSQNDLHIKIKTWQKESFSLFDYENQNHLKEQTFQISNGGYLIKNNNEIQWFDEEIDWAKSVIKQDQVLFQVEKVNGVFQIINSKLRSKLKDEEEDHKFEQITKYNYHDNKDFQQSENLDHVEGDEFHQPYQQSELIKNVSMSQRTNTKLMEKGNKLWLVLRSTQNLLSRSGIKLRQGDVVKMGRVKFRIREINLSLKKGLTEQQNSVNSSQSDAINCRVCCSSAYSRNNPLVNPCKCSGSIKYIHLECLKKWLKSKLSTRQSENCVIYMWKNLECELCKFNYPPVFKSDEAFYDLVELSKPTDYPYLLMEITQKRYDDLHDNQNVGDESQQWNQCNGVYIISFENSKDLKIGRANETEIRVNDISVSRSHATIKLTDGDLYVSDNKSKFGTLLLIQQETIPLLKEFNGIEMQVGRSVIQFFMGNSTQQYQIDTEAFDKLVGAINDEDDDYD